jgi:hypothetical protein
MVNINFFDRSVTVGDPVTLWWSFMTQAIIYGLLFATALTLIVTPCMLMARQNLSNWISQKIFTIKNSFKSNRFSEIAEIRK